MSTATVVGAGVFGAATARELARRGWDVTLVEQYTPGNVRSASGGDSRLIRFAHGEAEWYSRLAMRALELWRELEAESGARLFEQVGVAWFGTGEGTFLDDSEATLRRLGVRHERLTPEEAQRLFPSLGGDDLHSVLFEPDAGVIYARQATQELARGLRLETRHVDPSEPPRTDVVVWACGAWLANLFPDAVELRVSRRDVFFLGVDGAWAGVPGFCDYDDGFYGHGDLGGLGMKVAPDRTGDPIDPDTVDRRPLEANEQAARAYAARRFPALAGAPAIGARVCQYSLTGDTHFLVSQHPEHPSWWLVGGGSGHGYKHGPALGEYVADCIEGARAPEPFHALGPRVGQAGMRTTVAER
jgi:glycine/D-amino acid oxidase-like deaminating enzyme